LIPLKTSTGLRMTNPQDIASLGGEGGLLEESPADPKLEPPIDPRVKPMMVQARTKANP
jgi:hypothetical protein